jgi:hypothetical protein
MSGSLRTPECSCCSTTRTDTHPKTHGQAPSNLWRKTKEKKSVVSRTRKKSPAPFLYRFAAQLDGDSRFLPPCVCRTASKKMPRHKLVHLSLAVVGKTVGSDALGRVDGWMSLVCVAPVVWRGRAVGRKKALGECTPCRMLSLLLHKHGKIHRRRKDVSFRARIAEKTALVEPLGNF